MQLINIFDHAMSFANHIKSNVQNIHTVLRKYESKIVVDDEIERSVEALRSLPELRRYFSEVSFSQKTTVFLPLNLPLYSFILFVAMPSYQSVSLVVRPPNRMQDVFAQLFDVLSLEDYYPNVRVFAGYRKDFLTKHCKDASVVIFTGQYENFLHIRKECCKDSLILFNGAGHNPLVITPSADIDLAVKKTLQVKLFNNGQDCAGPNIILAHSSIVDVYLTKLITNLAEVRCGTSYQDNNVIVGPLFESSSLLDIVNLMFAFTTKKPTTLSSIYVGCFPYMKCLGGFQISSILLKLYRLRIFRWL